MSANKEKEILTVQMPNRLKERLQAIAEARMTSVSQLVREILASHVNGGGAVFAQAVDPLTLSPTGEEEGDGRGE